MKLDPPQAVVPNILVVDDTPANLVVLCEMLQSKGYKPRPVPSGELALRTAASLPPDLVLLDISMPGMDGYQTCASLKRNPALAEVPVIFVTARHEADSKVRGFSLGAVDYITKPFQLEEVEARVRLHLELARLRHEQARHVAQLEEAVALRTRELLKAKDRLAILDRAKSDFLSLISHELRTPLHGVLGVAEMLLAANTDPDGATYKEIYEQSRQRLMSLIDDALLLTQIGVGVAGDAHATSDLLAVLWEARHRAEAFAAGRRVKFAPVPTDLGTVQGKANFLVRAIESLLVTAAKFAQPGTAVRLAGSPRRERRAARDRSRWPERAGGAGATLLRSAGDLPTDCRGWRSRPGPRAGRTHRQPLRRHRVAREHLASRNPPGGPSEGGAESIRRGLTKRPAAGYRSARWFGKKTHPSGEDQEARSGGADCKRSKPFAEDCFPCGSAGLCCPAFRRHP
jgi:two-component system sensor histidine kinase/response regulator